MIEDDAFIMHQPVDLFGVKAVIVESFEGKLWRELNPPEPEPAASDDRT